MDIWLIWFLCPFGYIAAYHHLVRKRSDGVESQYQVFMNFTDYLYISLVNARVCVFSVDNPSLIGKGFVEEVYNAIKISKVSIPIISQHYASST